MSEAEAVYTSRQVAQRLGVSAAMARRYASTLEQVTGQPIRQHPRDGRQFTESQVAAITTARALVEANARLSVEDALRHALGQVPEGAAPEALEVPGTQSEALEMAFARALERSLLPELRELRAEVAALRSEAREDRAAPPESPSTLPIVKDPGMIPGPDDDGFLVKLAKRLERTFRRFG